MSLTKRLPTSSPVDEKLNKLSIGQLAKLTGVGVETIRFYHRQKILEIPSTRMTTIRYYDSAFVEKIEFIKRAQSVGFSLTEIKEILKLRLTPTSECTPIKIKTQKKIKEVEIKITELNRILAALKKFESKCDGHETTERCSILDGLKELKRG